METAWREILRGVRCPACQCCSRFSRHGVYEKYHYRRLIAIVRVRCRGCSKTHALIPSFSLPGTSIGCGEVERFIRARCGGASRTVASLDFLNAGFGEHYARFLERRVLIAIHQAKALFPQHGDHSLPPYRWLIGAAGAERPVYTLNRLSIDRGWGAVFCSLAVGAGRRAKTAGRSGSHDTRTAGNPTALVDSG